MCCALSLSLFSSCFEAVWFSVSFFVVEIERQSGSEKNDDFAWACCVGCRSGSLSRTPSCLCFRHRTLCFCTSPSLFHPPCRFCWLSYLCFSFFFFFFSVFVLSSFASSRPPLHGRLSHGLLCTFSSSFVRLPSLLFPLLYSLLMTKKKKKKRSAKEKDGPVCLVVDLALLLLALDLDLMDFEAAFPLQRLLESFNYFSTSLIIIFFFFFLDPNVMTVPDTLKTSCEQRSILGLCTPDFHTAPQDWTDRETPQKPRDILVLTPFFWPFFSNTQSICHRPDILRRWYSSLSLPSPD